MILRNVDIEHFPSSFMTIIVDIDSCFFVDHVICKEQVVVCKAWKFSQFISLFNFLHNSKCLVDVSLLCVK